MFSAITLTAVLVAVATMWALRKITTMGEPVEIERPTKG
jgi:hypothetical protein